MSKISSEAWITSPNSTNVAEAAHALSNRRGKSLKLLLISMYILLDYFQKNYNLLFIYYCRGRIG